MPQTPDNPLFAAKDVQDWLREPVSDEQAAMAERVVWGWLRPLLDIDERPAPENLDDSLFAWAVELGGIAVKNPGGLAEHQLDTERQKFGVLRRQEILALAASGGTDTAGSPTPAPAGRFGPRPAYPDPAERAGWSW